MLTFEYSAKDPGTGKIIKAQIQADTELSAAKLIKNEGLVPMDIKPKASGSSIFKRSHIRAKDKVLFSRQLSTLINAGLPLTQSLRTVAEQTANKNLVIIINSVIASVEAGTSLSASLAKHPAVFDDVYINLVGAGEASGTLDETLQRIANQQEKDAEINAKVKGALVYPVIVLSVIVLVIVFMLVVVLPQVEQLYVDLDQDLPFLTKGLLFVADIIKRFWWLIIAIDIGLVWFFRKWTSTTEAGRSFFDKFKMKVPLFGRMFMKMYMARFARTGQTLMSSGVPMLEMMDITSKAVDNVHIEHTLNQAAQKVKGGKALSSTLKGQNTFLPLVPQMLSIGEQSGSIDSMLGKVASFYEKELDNEIKALSTSIEPILMVFLAGVAGLMVGAILIPIYGLVGQNV